MDQRHVQYYRDLIAKNPDKKDLILDGAYALYLSGNKFDTPPDLDTILNYGKQYQADQPLEITKGFSKATQEMQASGFGALGLVGSAVGSDKLRDYGYEGYRRNMAEAEEVAPRVNKVEDIGSLSDATDWFMGTLGSLGPSVIEAGAAALAGGGIGGLAAKRVGKEAVETAVEKYVAMRVAEGATEAAAREAAAGMVGKFAKSIASGHGRDAGLVAGVAPVESGSMFGQSADEVGVENVNPYVTGLMGTISAASELAGPEGELLTNGIKKYGRGSIFKEYIKDTVKEGGQEVVQQGLGDVNRLVNNPDATLSGSDYLNAFAAGSIGGLSFGAPSAARGLMSPKAPQDIIKSAKGEAAPVEAPVVDEQPIETERPPIPGMGVVKSKYIEPLPGMGIFNQEPPMASGLQVDPVAAPVESVQPMPVEEQPTVNAGLPVEPETIQEPSVFNVKNTTTLDDVTYTHGENAKGKPAIFAHDANGNLLDEVTYKNHGIAETEFGKLSGVAPVEQPIVPAMGLKAMPKTETKNPSVPAKGLSLDQDEFGGMGLPVYESKPTDIPVNPQINMAEELKGEEDGKIHSVPNTGVVDNRKYGREPVVGVGENIGEQAEKKPVKEPFKAPEGVKLTSTGGPFKISGAKKAVANHTKRTGEAAEVVDLGGGNFGWKVSDKKENRTLDSVGRVKDGVGIKDDEVFTMASGRKTTPYPKYTHLKSESAKSLKSDQWLIENAVSEAKERGDDFNGNWINRLKPGKLSPSDYDSLNMYLFDGEMDKVLSESKQKNILRPLVVNETPVDAQQTDLTLKDSAENSVRPAENSANEQKEPPISKTETAESENYQKHSIPINIINPQEGFTEANTIGKHQPRDISQPIRVSIDHKGNVNIEDGHHRYFSAIKRGEKNIDVVFNKQLSSAEKSYVDKFLPGILEKSKADQPSVETVTEPVKAESSQEADRRQDTNRRKTVSEMSPEEMKRELLTDYLTGLGNKRAYEESEKKAHQVSIDADALKWVNDNLGHPTGDKLLKKIGEALKQEGLEAYHISGDEYYIQSDSDVFLEDAVKKAYSYLKENPINVTLPDGTKALFTGGFSYGRGQNIEEAETRLQLHKTERELSGSRSVRGAEPSGSIRKISEGNEDNSGRGRGDVEGQVTAEKPSEESAENRDIEIETSGSKKDVSVNISSAKESNLSPKEQKEYLLKEDETTLGTIEEATKKRDSFRNSRNSNQADIGKVKADGAKTVNDGSPKFSKSTDTGPTASLSELTGKQRSEIEKLQKAGKVNIISNDEAMSMLETGNADIRSGEGGKVQGFVLNGKAYIVLENIQQGNLWNVIRHEIGVHMGQLMQGRPEFNRILKTIENLKNSDTKQGELVRKAFDRVPKDTKPEHITEEALAYLVESAPEIGIVRRFITMVKRLLMKMGVSPMIFNQADYAALADAAIRKEAGRVSGAGKMMEGMGQFAQDAKMSIEKAKMAIQNLPAFKKWFGDSKVVDEDGGPLVVYHGTSDEFTSFDLAKTGRRLDSGFLGKGIYLTDNPSVADYYSMVGAGKENSGARVLPLFVSIKNPFMWGKKTLGARGEVLKGHGIPEEIRGNVLKEAGFSFEEGAEPDFSFEEKISEAITNTLIKMGYDGIIAETRKNGSAVNEIVAFNPAQIKSVFNQAWDPKNPDIMMSKRQISEPLYSISDAKDHITEAFDDGIEYAKNLYERRGEIKPAIQGAIKYRNEKGPGDKTDVSYLAKSFGLISHFSKSIPAMARTFNAALRNGDIKTMVEQQLTHGANGEKFIQTIDRFRRKAKEEYNRLDRYLHNRDLNQIGYRVKELDLDKATDLGGKYAVVDLKHKDTSHVYETENEAWEKVMDLEAEDYIQDGGSQEAANIIKLFRTINNRSFDLRISRFREVEQYCRDHGVEMPQIVYEEKGKEIQVDLKQKLIEMGDRRGYYMPRIRKPGEHMLYAKKDGSSPIMKFYDLKTVANMAKGSFESKGYTVTVRQAGNLSEDLFEQLGSILSQQALINESMKEINKGNRVVALKDLDIKSEMDGDTLVLSGDFKDEFIQTLEKRGGVKKVREHFSGKTKIVTIEYRFENAKKNLEEDLSKDLFKIDGVTNLLQDVALRFAGAFVSQYADVIRSRGSRSAMIGRSDKVGDEVALGFEEDALTRVVRATLSLAGGEAKSRTALSMIEAITGRDIKWAKFSEIKRFNGTFEEFEKQALENDEQYIDRATFEEIKNKWDGEPQYLDYIEFLDNRGIDPGKQKVGHSESMALFKDMMRNEEKMDRVIGTFKGLAVLKFLAFRVSSPAVNLLNMVVAVPAVMNGFGKIPLRKTYRLIANAYKDYIAFTNNTLEDKEMVKVFSEIEKRGWGNQTLNQEGIHALQNKLQFGYSKMLETSMWLFGFTEKLNRVGTIAATYKGLLGSMPNLTFEERLNKAHEISNDAHGIYGKEGRPSILRGGGVAANILQMGYVFKVFAHQYLSTMVRLGFVEKERKAALYMAFFPAIFGLGSSIGTSWAINIIGSLWSDDPEEELYKIIESRFGTYAGNFSRFGVFGMFGHGISVKGSMEAVGISDLPTSFKDIVGAPGSVPTDIYDGFGELKRGNGMKAAEKFLPTGLGAPVKAYREYTEGITTKSNAPVFFEGKPLKADAIDAFLRALSFNPSRIAGAREKLWGEKVSEQAFMERRKDIYSRVKKYYLDTDRNPEDLQDIEIDIAAYNQRAKNSGQTVIKAKNIKSILKRAKIEE